MSYERVELTDKEVLSELRDAVDRALGHDPEHPAVRGFLDRLPALLAAEAECDRLREEDREWALRYADRLYELESSAVEIIRLTQRVAELEQDAARWRYVRPFLVVGPQFGSALKTADGGPWPMPVYIKKHDIMVPRSETTSVDEAIDAARAEDAPRE